MHAKHLEVLAERHHAVVKQVFVLTHGAVDSETWIAGKPGAKSLHSPARQRLTSGLRPGPDSLKGIDTRDHSTGLQWDRLAIDLPWPTCGIRVRRKSHVGRFRGDSRIHASMHRQWHPRLYNGRKAFARQFRQTFRVVLGSFGFATASNDGIQRRHPTTASNVGIQRRDPTSGSNDGIRQRRAAPQHDRNTIATRSQHDRNTIATWSEHGRNMVAAVVALA
jgi:hypothetical protein